MMALFTFTATHATGYLSGCLSPHVPCRWLAELQPEVGADIDAYYRWYMRFVFIYSRSTEWDALLIDSQYQAMLSFDFCFGSCLMQNYYANIYDVAPLSFTHRHSEDLFIIVMLKKSLASLHGLFTLHFMTGRFASITLRIISIFMWRTRRRGV